MSAEPLQIGSGRRVVITGLGAVTPLGNSAEDLWKACLSGCSGVSRITAFDPSEYTTQIAAQVKNFEPTQYMEKKDARRMDRFVHFAAAAARMAIEDSGLQITPDNAERVGTYIGSGIGGLSIIEEQHTTLLERGPSRISPFLIPGIICGMGAGLVAIMLGAKGPSSCVTTACAVGNNNIGDAFWVIKRGDADAMITGGTEAGITPLGIAGFCAARTMSQRNDEPERASRPFEKDRDGFLMGEGSGILILEELQSALARNARIYGEITGYGATTDAYHITSPAPEHEGAARSMRMALKQAGLAPEAVSYINAHGTSTDLNDKNETAAIKHVFGENAYNIPVSSTKSMTGHLIGAAGAVEAVISTLAIRDNMVPPTINYENPDPSCDLDYVPNQARAADVRIVMSNAFGFGGHNATIIMQRYEG